MPSADSWETNDTRLTATNLTGYSGAYYASMTIDDSTDYDWIKIRLTTNGTSDNYIGVENIVGGDIDLQLYDANGNYLTSSTCGGTSSERISLSGRSAGVYYARVYGFAGATGSYRFTFNTTPTTTDDRYENNDTISTATALSLTGAGTVSSLNIVSGDPDFYRFTLSSTGTSSNYIGINLTHSVGDLDICLYNASGSLITGSYSCSNTERISLSGLSAGTYYLKVYGYCNARGNYTIAYNLPTNSFTADSYESNNTLSTATDLTNLTDSGTISNLSIHTTSDYDFYRFRLLDTGTSSDYLRINFTHSVGDLDMVLYNANGSQIRGSYSCSNSETISLSGLAAGNYYLKVYGFNNARGNYSLSYSLPEDEPTDTYEGNGNNTLQTASTAFQNGGSGNAYIGANDVDYYKVVLDHTGTSADKIRVTLNHSVGDLDIFLYNANGTLLKSSRGVTNTEELLLTGYLAGTYYVKVEGWCGATGAYNINVSLTAGSAGLAADEYDSNNNSNNTMATAVDLRTLSGADSVGSNLTIHSSSDVDYYKFTIAENGGSNDSFLINHIYSRGDIDARILNASGSVVRSALSCSNYETVSLSGLAAGTYYLKVYGYSGAVNSYALSYTVDQYNNISADSYESQEPITIRQSQTISGLSISANATNVTQADTFSIVLAATGTASSKIVFSNYRSDWNGLSWQLKSGDTVLTSGTGSTVELNGRAAGTYTLVVDTPYAGEYSNYSLTASLPTAPAADDSTTTPGGSTGDDSTTTPGGSTGSDSTTTNDERLAVLVYVAADNNLESAALSDLLEMQRANLSADVDVYVMVDRCAGYATAQGNWTDTRVGKVVHNTGSSIVIDWTSWGELNTGSAATLTRFLNWGASQANADKYAVIMWDHGGAMTGGMSDYASNDDHLSMAEMRNGFLNADADFRNKLMVVGFDACLMGAAEVVETFNGIADYIVASEESIGNSGWNYSGMLNRLEGSMTAEEIASAMVDAGEDSSAVWTLSAVDASGALTTALNTFAAASSNFSNSDWNKIATAFRNAHSYSYAWMSDLVDVLNRISGGSSALTAAVNALKTTLEEDIIIRNYADGSSYGQGNGIAVVNPIIGGSSVMNYFTSNLSLGSSAWGNFLRTLAGRDNTTNSGSNSGNNTTSTVARQNAFGEVVLANYSEFRSDVPYTASNLGVFSGRGMELTDLHVSGGDKKFYIFDLGSLNVATGTLYDMEAGDSVIFDVEDGKSITVRLTDVTGNTVYSTTGGSGRVILDLNVAGLNDWSSDATTPMSVVMEVSSTEDVNYSLSFEAGWATGVDYFDYALGGQNTSRISDGGNNIIDKATVIAAGNYGGLLTHTGDADYYKIDSSRFSQSVTVVGDDLTVQVRRADDSIVYGVEGDNGIYRLVVEDDEYLYVVGNREITAGLGNNLSTYSISVGNRLNTIDSATKSDFTGNRVSDILFQNLNNNLGNPLGAWLDADSTQWVGDLGPAPLSDWTVYGAYDFTGDGVSDIIFRSKKASTQYAVGYYDMGRNREFKTMGWGVSAEWELVGVGDFNGNGTSDVLWQNTTNGYLGCWLDGTNNWVALPGSQLSSRQPIVAIGDMNDDYKDDIIINSNGVLGAWDISDIIAGEPNSLPEWEAFGITISDAWDVVGGADFDGNGEVDLVLWNDNGVVGTYMNCEASDFRTIFPSASKSEWAIPGFGDYNGDGCDDILVRNLETGALGFWDGADNFRWNAIGFGVDSTWSVIA